MQTVPRGNETSGFLKGDGAIYQGERANVFSKKGRPDGHDSGSIFKPTDESIVQTTPFSAGRGWCGTCQTAIYYLFFLAVYPTTGIVSIMKLFDESDTYDAPSSCDTAHAGKMVSGDKGDHDSKCCPDPSNYYACHVYFDFEAHIKTAFVLCAVLPFLAIVVGSLYYGFWWKPMSSLNGFHATIGTIYYAHLILILMCTGVVYYWMSEADGYNFSLKADLSTGMIEKTPIGANTGRVNAVKNDDKNDVFGALFALNAIILAGSIAFPLTGISMALNSDDGRDNRDVFGR